METTMEPLTMKAAASRSPEEHEERMRLVRNVLLRRKLIERRKHLEEQTKQVDSQEAAVDANADAQAAMLPQSLPLSQQSEGSLSAVMTAPRSQEAHGERLRAYHAIVRRKLQEKKRFDSADYQLQPKRDEASQHGASQSGHHDASLNVEETKPVKATSYHALSAQNVLLRQRLREKERCHESNQKSYSGSKGPSTSQATAPVGGDRMRTRLLLVRMKLQEKKRFDSADYQLQRMKNQQQTAAETTQRNMPSVKESIEEATASAML